MNKKLIALAVAAGMAAPMVASAEATVYGRAYAEIAMETTKPDGGDSTTARTQDDNQGHGRIGFKFNEDLGGNLSAFGKFEIQVDINDTVAAGNCERVLDSSGAKIGTTNGSAYCQRDSFVGLKGGWGAFSAGRYNGAYKTTGGVKYDPFVATGLQARGNGGMAAGAYAQNGFVSQLIEYKTPKLGGFGLQLQYNLTDNDDDLDNNGEGDLLAGASFNIGKNHEIIAAYSDSKSNENADGKSSNMKAGYKGTFGAFGVTLQYEDAQVASQAGQYLYANGTWKMGKNLWVLGYGQTTDDEDVPGGADTTYLAIGGIYGFSKMTKLYYGYRNTDVKDVGKQDVIAVGMRQDF